MDFFVPCNRHQNCLNKYLLNELEIIQKQLRDGKQYIKGEYKINCSNNCNDVSDHC